MLQPAAMPALRTLVAAAVLVGAVADRAAAEAPTRLTFEQVLARAQEGPRARMAAGDTDAARARVAEADAARLPKVSATAFVAPSPDIECLDATCTRTDPEDFALRFSGVLGGGSLSAVQPVFTFGKIAAARAAARSGVVAQEALEDAGAGDTAVDAGRAYWGLKLARELVYMLEDGIAEIDKALARLDERGSEITLQDKLRIQTLVAEARIQLSDARQAEAQALAGLRALVGLEDADVDEAPIEALATPLGDEPGYLARAAAGRPEIKAALAGARAADRLADFEARHYFPDLAVVGQLGITRAQGVDDPPSALIVDPFNQTSGALLLVLRWQLEPWTTRAKVARARAAARKADALADLAAIGASYEARIAYAEAAQARERLTAAAQGEQSARAWLASVLQADAIGTSEPKDLADSYIAWFQMRARQVNAMFQWNVATIRLGRATGEYRRKTPRPQEHR
jgi:outer membrane protein TolC